MNCFFKFKRKDKAIETDSALELRIHRGSNLSLKKQQDLRAFSPEELRKATENFNGSLKIGEGGFSNVYKGTIKLDHGRGNPTVVAIKRVKPESLQADKEWYTQVHLLRSVDHPNLVKLLGYCLVDGKREIYRLLVYEYMPNKGLDNHLFDISLPALSWKTRLQIMLGAAEGFAYLHEELEVPIIHRNFKPSHVLLDESFRAKLSGFSLAREGSTGDESYVSTVVAGTLGYIDPVYVMTGHLSLKSDIYSYGVVLYEILTGRRVIDRLRSTQFSSLLEWVQQFRDVRRRLHMIMDIRLQNQYCRSAAIKVAELADRCISRNPEDRPNMWEIIAALREAISESNMAGEESHSDLSIPSLHFPPTESYYVADVSKSISALKGTDSAFDMAQLESPSDLSIGSFHSDPSQCLSPTPQGEIIPASSKTGPVLNEYQPSPDVLSPAEQDSDWSPYESFDDEQSASISVARHPHTDAIAFEKNQGRGLDLEKEVERKRMLFLFQEGYEFEKEMLIQLWMALGLLSDEPMEVIGANYFKELVSEGYILCSVASSLYKVDTEKLNTGLHMSPVKKNYIKLDNGNQNDDTSTETLHASVVCDEINASIFKTLGGFKRLRTLLFLGNYGSRLQQVPRDLFLCYESLEALDLSGTHIKELPSSAGKMINLRYLDLSWTFIEVLPERIDRFQKLQTLKLEGCSRLRRLPKETKGLTELRHLHLDVLRQLASLPEGMGALVNIHSLSAFPVGSEEGLKISELKYLNEITGSFCIAKIENVQSAEEAKEASLTDKKKIKKLKLRWSNYQVQEPGNEEESILENLCPHSDLEEMQILCYPGTCFPDWIADVAFHKLVSITLFRCVHAAKLPSLEKLPSLVSLELITLNGVTKIDFKGVADHVAFPKLQKLAVDGMLNVQTWTEAEEGDYPCLIELSIKDCPELLEFPSLGYLPSLKQLEVSGCTKLAFASKEKLSTSLQELIIEDCPLIEQRSSKDGGKDWHRIQHVPTIWINQVAIQVHENV